jgi:CDP-diglyceride synthetase
MPQSRNCRVLATRDQTWGFGRTSLLLSVGPHANVHHSIMDTNRNADAIWWEDIAVGLGLSVAAILGDTWESAVKRHYRAKDTSHFLLGQGGILDRFDTSMVAVLVYQAFLETSSLCARNRRY